MTGIPGCWRCLCLLVKIVCENAWLVHIIRHLRRRFAHTISTQQEMEISLRSFPFPTVLSTIYRLRRIPGFLIYRLRWIPDSRFTVFVRFIANRFRVIAYPWSRIFASILPENQPPYGVLVDF